MSIINNDFADRLSRISEALEALNLNDLEERVANGSNLSSGLVYIELYKEGKLIGSILYEKEPPKISSYDQSFEATAQKLWDYFKTKI